MIRQPEASEKSKVTPLIYLSGPSLFNYFFASERDDVLTMVGMLYNAPDNAFSRECIWIDAENGEINGAILVYPGYDKMRLEKNIGKSGKEIMKIAGLLKSIKMMIRSGLGRYLDLIEDDELYISNLAVSEHSRGKGVSSKLLDKAGEIAVEKGLQKLSLFADIRNSHAIGVYEKKGFMTTARVDLPKKYHRHDITGFIKMIKEV